MSIMQIASDLRRLADSLESRGETDMRLRVRVSFYECASLSALQFAADLMDSPRADKSGGRHWLSGDFAE